MSYPIIRKAISDMVPKVALETRMARSIARKGGLRAGETAPAATVIGRARTILSAWVEPHFVPFENQWYVDLSPYTQVRTTIQEFPHGVAIFYSLASPASTTFDPGSWSYFALSLDGERAQEFFDTPLGWGTLPEFLKVPIRLTLGYDLETFDPDFTLHPTLSQGPFSVMIEAA